MSVATDGETYVAVGRRKTATARVRICRGTGKFLVNGKDYEVYFYTEQLAKSAALPLVIADLVEGVDVKVNVQGGGPNGQATAVSHGLSRALEKLNSELRSPLKKEGLLRRDPRKRERKKAGQPGARKRFQFSKR